MIQGLVMFDASARLVTFNRRYIEMYNLSTDIVKPGCHFRDLMQHRKDSGSFDGDVDEFCSACHAKHRARARSTHSIMQCADGRSILAVSKPLADGGWVATMEDITERRRPRAGARPQLRLPAPDHRSHPLADHREGCA